MTAPRTVECLNATPFTGSARERRGTVTGQAADLLSMPPSRPLPPPAAKG